MRNVMRKDGRAALLENAKTELNRNWQQWRAGAELRGEANLNASPTTSRTRA
jgi:hypothetical protein